MSANKAVTGDVGSGGVLFPSLILLVCCGFLGAFMSALGPSVPALARDLGVLETDLGVTFTSRGLGYCLGASSSALKIAGNTRLKRMLNNQMNRLGVAVIAMGMFSLAIRDSPTLVWVSVSTFLQGLFIGGSDTLINTAMNKMYANGGIAPWMQAVHFAFSFGALISPAAVGQFGYRAVFLFSGVLSIPSGLASLAAGALQDEHSRRQERSGRDASGEATPLIPDALAKVEAEAAAGEPKSYGDMSSDARAADVTPDGATPSIDAEKPQMRGEEIDDRGQGSLLPEMRASNAGDISTSVSGFNDTSMDKFWNEADRELSTKIVILSRGEEIDGSERSGDEKLYLCEAERRSKEVLRTHCLLVGLLASALFVFVGGEVAYGGWIAVVILRDFDSSETTAARIASLFWGGATIGRLLAIPVTAYYDNNALLGGSLIGAVASSTLLLVMGRVSLVWVLVSTGLYGFSTASMFPLAMSLPATWGYTLSDTDISKLVVSAAFGEMTIPWLVSWLLRSWEWPSVLYAASMGISLLMAALFMAARRVAERRAWPQLEA